MSAPAIIASALLGFAVGFGLAQAIYHRICVRYRAVCDDYDSICGKLIDEVGESDQ